MTTTRPGRLKLRPSTAQYRHIPSLQPAVDRSSPVQRGLSAQLPHGNQERHAAPSLAFAQFCTDPVASLVRVQRLAVELAARRGMNPERPRHLSRWVTLADAGRTGVISFVPGRSSRS